MQSLTNTLEKLFRKIGESEHIPPITLKEFLDLAADRPHLTFRNIFEVFHDLITTSVDGGVEEYPDDPDFRDLVYYDLSKLFVDGMTRPFFADRIFANRLINNFASHASGAQQNRIYIFQGPHGSGKSTFLNNLLMKFEHYTRTVDGSIYEIIWRLDKRELATLSEEELYPAIQHMNHSELFQSENDDASYPVTQNKQYLEIPCPSHDHPILIIPKNYRKELLDDLISDRQFKQRLFTEKQYEWIFRDNPCTICMSLSKALMDTFGSPEKLFDMVYARKYEFNRRLGEGISIFNPGDRLMKTNVMTNHLLQHQLNYLLQDSNRVKYIFSKYAKTNNGIYAIMDVKGYNKARFKNLHGIISEGIHKVEDIEENVNSLFLVLMNPDDQIEIADDQSFLDRITYIRIPYVLDYTTEVKIYRSIFGDHIEESFLPGVLSKFAQVIITTRLNFRSEGIQTWLQSAEKYDHYVDAGFLLLKMDIYRGHLPSWLSEEDRKSFNAHVKKQIIAESESEGNGGLSGRDSINLFSEFYSTFAKKDKHISIDMVYNFFKKYAKNLNGNIPDGFLDALVRHYDYSVLEEVKESLYYYNETRISLDIQNYLYGINFELESVIKCSYTGEELHITGEFLKGIETYVLGENLTESQRLAFRKDIQKRYASRTLTHEIMIEGKNIVETELYQQLHERYLHNLKEKVMEPFLENANFRNAIKDYATDSFKTYDKRIREDVTNLMKNLNKKCGYSEQGAKEICIYVIDKDLPRMFSQSMINI